MNVCGLDRHSDCLVSSLSAQLIIHFEIKLICLGNEIRNWTALTNLDLDNGIMR